MPGVDHVFNPYTREADTGGGKEVKVTPQPHRNFKASLGYRRP